MNLIKFFLPFFLVLTSSWGQDCPYNKKKMEKVEALKGNIVSDLQKDFEALDKADKECLYKSSQDPERIRIALETFSLTAVPDIQFVPGLNFGGRKVKCLDNFNDFKYHLDTEIMSDIGLMFEIASTVDFVDPVTLNPRASTLDVSTRLRDRLPIKGNGGADFGSNISTTMTDCYSNTMIKSQFLTESIKQFQLQNSLDTTFTGDSTFRQYRVKAEEDVLRCVSSRLYGGPDYLGKTDNNQTLLLSQIQSAWVVGCKVATVNANGTLNTSTNDVGMQSITENLIETDLVKKQRQAYNSALTTLYSTISGLVSGVNQNSACSASQNIRNLIGSASNIGIGLLTMNSGPAVVALSQLGAVLADRVINWGAYLFGDVRATKDILASALKTLTPDRRADIFKRYACHLWSVAGLSCEMDTRKKYEYYNKEACEYNSLDSNAAQLLDQITKLEQIVAPMAIIQTAGVTGSVTTVVPLPLTTVADLSNNALTQLTGFFFNKAKDEKGNFIRDAKGRAIYQPTNLYNKFFGEGENDFYNTIVNAEDNSLDSNQFSTANYTYASLKDFINKINPENVKRIQDEAIEKEVKAKGSELDKSKEREIMQAELKKYVADIQINFKDLKKNFGDLQVTSPQALSPFRYVVSKYNETMMAKADPAQRPFYVNMLYNTVATQYAIPDSEAVVSDRLAMTSNALQTIQDVNDAMLSQDFYGSFKDDVSGKIRSLQDLGGKQRASGNKIATNVSNTIFEQLVYPILQDCLMSFQFAVLWEKDVNKKSPLNPSYLSRCEPLMGKCSKKYLVPKIGRDVMVPHYADPTAIDSKPACLIQKNYDSFMVGVANEFAKTGKVCDVDPLEVYQNNKKAWYEFW